jgi:hypothetical protein
MHTLTANIGNVHALSICFFEGRMFSGWIVTNITSARGNLHCRKTLIPCGDRLVVCGMYPPVGRWYGMARQKSERAARSVEHMFCYASA